MSKLISPDFTENYVSLMVQSLLIGIFYPKAPFVLIPFLKSNEVKFSADAIVESVSPLYIQFKKSFAYPKDSKSKLITDRNKLKVNCSPKILFFNIKGKRIKQKDYQHNVLFDLKIKLDDSDQGEAFYTAPLLLNKGQYLKSIIESNFQSKFRFMNSFRNAPFHLKAQNIITSAEIIKFANMPILDEHIVVHPREKVTSHKHRYSYLETGNDVCFHEPTKLEINQILGQTIYDYLKIQNGQPTRKMTNLQKSASLLNTLQNELFEENKLEQSECIIERWLKFGEKLKIEYDIFQFMLVKINYELK